MDEECGVCFVPVRSTRSGSSRVHLGCGHAMHPWCWRKWDAQCEDRLVNTTCPMCRHRRVARGGINIGADEMEWDADVVKIQVDISPGVATTIENALARVDACLRGDPAARNAVVYFRAGESDPRPLPKRQVAKLRNVLAQRLGSVSPRV